MHHCKRLDNNVQNNNSVISLKDDFRKQIILKPFPYTIRSPLNPVLAFSLNNEASNVKCEELHEKFKGRTGHYKSHDVDVTTSCYLSVHELPPRVSFYNMMTEDAISVAISRMKSSTCVLDPIPAKLFKASFQCLSQEATIIIKCSLSSGLFPKAFKTAMVKPLLKK